MKPVIIFSEKPGSKSSPLPVWLKGKKARKFSSVESYQKSLKKTAADHVLILAGGDVQSALRQLRRNPMTALSLVAACDQEKIAGVDVDAQEELPIRKKFSEIGEIQKNFNFLDSPESFGDLSILFYLRYLVSRGMAGEPAVVDPLSSSGYSYPLSALFLTDSLETEPEELAKIHFLVKQFRDTVHLCPHCDRYNLNFREICPECTAANIGVGEVLHHFRCGEIAPESLFARGEILVCPKCRQELRHLGVDYDRPTEFCACRSCSAVFAEPTNDVFCFSCASSSKIAELRERAIYDYWLSEEGHAAAKEGLLPAAAIHQLFDHELGELYSLDFFNEFTKIESRRNKRYGGPFSLLAMQIDFPEGKTLSVKRLQQMVWGVARLLREQLRDSDVLARGMDHLYLAALTDTPIEDATRVAARLEEEVQRVVSPFGGRFLIREITKDFLAQQEEGIVDFNQLVTQTGANS